MSGEVEPDNDIEIKKGGRPRAVIWNFFIEGPDQGDGHRSAICSACNTTWKRGKASAMERHILLDCKKVKTEVREAIRCIIESRNKSQMSRNTDDDQKTLEEYYDALPLSEEKRIKIELSLIRLFVCCGLSWRLVEHPYFVEFIKELRSAYNLPNRKTLSEANLADCFFLLAKLGAVIKNIPETVHKMFRRHCVGIVEGQFVRISTTAVALWQQMLRIPEILTMVKRNKHSKRKSGEILIAQLPSYIYNIDTPIRCHHLQYLATKMFSVSPHAANCERIWSVCGWIHGTRRTKILVKNLDAIAQIHSYYIFNNKSELSHYGVEKSEEEIQQILRDADLYEEEEEITLEEIMTEINLEQTAIDDDLEAINDEPLELEEALNLSNSRFLHDASTPYVECDENDDSVDYTNLLMEYDEEGDYNPEELAKMFERFNV
ncbi:22438_t:CDS:2 [Rhizophagus irregularis]|nr:22438_t:CDS:2 [Rhizophagus irregularis]